jgi:zinc protease
MRKNTFVFCLLAGCAAQPAAAPEQVVVPRFVRTLPPGPLAEEAPHEAPVFGEARLENGLRVLVVKQTRRPIVMVRLMLGNGSASDPNDAYGATYFAVSQLGDLYEQRGGQKLLAERSLRWQVAEIGGALHTQVMPDDSWIGIDGYAKDTPQYLQMLGEAVTVPRRGPETFGARRTGMIHALEDLELSDELAFQRFLSRAAFGVDHAYSRPPFGSVTDLENISYEQVIEQQKRVLSPTAATLIVTGDVDPKLILKAARASFQKWRAPREALRTAIPPPAVTSNNRVTIIPREPAHSVAICAARPLTDVNASDAALDVLAAMLGESSGGRLGHELRGKNGLSYYAHASIVRMRAARSIFACTRVRPEDATLALSLFTETIHRFRGQPQDAHELDRAKALLIAKIEQRNESTQQAMYAAMESAQLRSFSTDAEQIAAIRAVSAGEIAELARTVLDKNTLRILLAGEPKHAKKAISENNLGEPIIARAVR